MLSTSVFEKVFLLRQTKLPFDIIEEINSFIFYDNECANARTVKRTILRVIKHPVMDGFDPNSGHWCFWADFNENQFQGSNCLKCGNYNYAVSDNIYLMCFCQNQHDNYPIYENTMSDEDSIMEEDSIIDDEEYHQAVLDEIDAYEDYRYARQEIMRNY